MNSTSHTIEPLGVISYFATSLYHKESIEEIYWDIAKNCIHQLGLEDCVLYQVDENKKVLVQIAAYGQKNPSHRNIYNRIEIPIGKGIVGHVAQSGQPVLIKDTTKDERYIIDDRQRLSEIAVPIFLQNKVIGVIDSEHSQKDYFTEEHLHIFTILATLCSQKIQTLKKARKKLDASNEYYQKLLVLLKEDKIYRNPNLSLQYLAEKIGISATYLSYLINDITTKGFADFINAYRVDEVKKNLQHADYNNFTLLSIGLEAGFNSKSSFNTIFKKHTGCAPSTFKRAHSKS